MGSWQHITYFSSSAINLIDTVGLPAQSFTAGAHKNRVEKVAGLNSAGEGATI